MAYTYTYYRAYVCVYSLWLHVCNARLAGFLGLSEFRLCALFKWGLFNSRKVHRESFLTPRQT